MNDDFPELPGHADRQVKAFWVYMVMLATGGIVFLLTNFPLEYWLLIILGVALFSAVLKGWVTLVAKCPNCRTKMSYEVHPSDPQMGLFVCKGCSAKWQTTATLRKKPTAGMDRIDI
jgi:hypothetical protein